jgi:hypothetical protein
MSVATNWRLTNTVGTHQSSDTLAAGGDASVCQLSADTRHTVGLITHRVGSFDLIEQFGVGY